MKDIIYFLAILLLIKSIDIYADDTKSEVIKHKKMSKEEKRIDNCSRYSKEPMMDMNKEELRKILYETLDSTKEFVPEEHKGKNLREVISEIRKVYRKRFDTEMSIVCSEKISEEDKLDLIMEDIYNVCKVGPNRSYVNVHYVNLMRLRIDDNKILNRVLKEISSERSKDECFNKSMVLMLGYMEYGSRDIGDRLIEIFDKDKYNIFRYRALGVFVSYYSDYYTKEELMPYIKKLMKEPYFSICKACDVRPEGCNGLKSYPFRSALKPLLIKYNIKFEYIQLDRCMIGGVPVLIEE